MLTRKPSSLEHDKMEIKGESERLLPRNRQSAELRFSNFKLEPALIVFYFGLFLSLALIPNQLLSQTCLSNGFNREDCLNITKEIEEEVQPEVARILAIISMMSSIVTGVWSLFLGSWSDKFGRKKVICTTFCGHALSQIIFVIISIDYKFPLSPWLFVVGYIPMIVTGGFSTMVVSILCFTTDLSNDENRSFRLTLIEVITFLGNLLGSSSSSYVLKFVGPSLAFLLAAACISGATLYTIIFVEESLEVMTNLSIWGQIGKLFSPAPVIEMLTTCFKPRPHKERAMIWSLIISLALSLFVIFGTFDLNYLFEREKFHWTIKEASLFYSASNIVAVLGSIVGLAVLKRKYGFSDVAIGIMSISSALAEALVRAFAQSPIQLYLAPAAGVLKNLALPMCRSLISTVIPRNEIGKIFSFTGVFEALVFLLAAPSFTYIYNATFIEFTGAIYLIIAGICGINILLVIGVKKMKINRDDFIGIEA